MLLCNVIGWLNMVLNTYSALLILTISSHCLASDAQDNSSQHSADWFSKPIDEMQKHTTKDNSHIASQVPDETKNIEEVGQSSTVEPIGLTAEPIEEGRDLPETSTLTTPQKEEVKCEDDNYCLNGGTCIVSESGQMLCICPEGFYGARCQTRNICKTLIADSLTGDQICAKIDRECFMNDKYFRCSCRSDEYFIFRNNIQQKAQFATTSEDMKQQQSSGVDNKNKRVSLSDIIGSKYSFEEMLNNESAAIKKSKSQKVATYEAECRKVNKCLGVRCRQMSEVCQEGVCVCNQNLGYIKDTSDDLCKLLDPCKQARPDGQPICGQAQCVPTYDQELYRCVCPIGYKPLKVGSSRSTTQCALLHDTICDVPLLNKCQHVCSIDRISNNYKCSCLPGYKAGTRKGIDDHMCFFDEHLNEESKYVEEGENVEQGRGSGSTFENDHRDYIYKPYLVPKQTAQMNHDQQTNDKLVDNTITYDPLTTTIKSEETSTYRIYELNEHDIDLKKLKTHETIIKRELRSSSSRASTKEASLMGARNNTDTDFSYGGINVNKMIAQDRCNMYCEENKICALESGTVDSYRCVCDRQGYVSVGDRCLDWCAAADFSYRVLGFLRMVCWSGVCKPSGSKPTQDTNKVVDDEQTRLERASSWRPTFECDCSSSPLLVQDFNTKLCKLDFKSVLKPCLPGNEGYIDCVEHKNAYCAVLHKNNWWSFIKDLQKERQGSVDANLKPASVVNSLARGKVEEVAKGSKTKTRNSADKLYTCVCSPDKKFLVDKPRNKERCVDECDLLNVECGRFNRMCRAATIPPDDFGRGNLVRWDPDGVRMNFRRTGCECLPGFNVGPSESVDFTPYDNNSPSNGMSVPPNGVFGVDIDPTTTNIIDIENPAESEQLRAKYMNINSWCLLDYDVVEFHASFKAPADFDPSWVRVKRVLYNSSHQKATKHASDGQSETSKNKSETSSTLASDGQREAISDSDHSGKPLTPVLGDVESERVLEPPSFMTNDISELHKNVVLVAQCDPSLAPLSIEAYRECTKYRYWIVQKLRSHFVDWRRVVTKHLSETFNLMEGNIKIRVNKCEATVRINTANLTSSQWNEDNNKNSQMSAENDQNLLDPTRSSSVAKYISPMDQHSVVDADIDCKLTLHSAGDDSSPRYARKVLLEKQLQKFIFVEPAKQFGPDYYLMAPDMLIRRESFDQLAEHRKLFNPCKSDYAYCDKQTKCEMVDTVNFTCTCEYGYTPIGSRDIYYEDSRKEVCEDINECLFDVCKELANVSTCINEIGDYRCQCNRHYVGDNKRFCTHVCNTISCKHGRCRLVDDHHAFCECDEGYRETDCSVQDKNVALRKANIIIVGSIFTSVLLLAISIAVTQYMQLSKTKKKLKRLEAINDTSNLFEYPHQQPFRTRMSSKLSSDS